MPSGAFRWGGTRWFQESAVSQVAARSVNESVSISELPI